jgi:homeobox protein YOX1/YHP1
MTNSALTQEPAPMMDNEQPAIKKKRKRADAAQLKVLNETYARTAFPSTEERAELAKKLDMSARSVQIWLVYCTDQQNWCSCHSIGSKTNGSQW